MGAMNITTMLGSVISWPSVLAKKIVMGERRVGGYDLGADTKMPASVSFWTVM